MMTWLLFCANVLVVSIWWQISKCLEETLQPDLMSLEVLLQPDENMTTADDCRRLHNRFPKHTHRLQDQLSTQAIWNALMMDLSALSTFNLPPGSSGFSLVPKEALTVMGLSV